MPHFPFYFLRIGNFNYPFHQSSHGIAIAWYWSFAVRVLLLFIRHNISAVGILRQNKEIASHKKYVLPLPLLSSAFAGRGDGTTRRNVLYFKRRPETSDERDSFRSWQKVLITAKYIDGKSIAREPPFYFDTL